MSKTLDKAVQSCRKRAILRKKLQKQNFRRGIANKMYAKKIADKKEKLAREQIVLASRLTWATFNDKVKEAYKELGIPYGRNND